MAFWDGSKGLGTLHEQPVLVLYASSVPPAPSLARSLGSSASPFLLPLDRAWRSVRPRMKKQADNADPLTIHLPGVDEFWRGRRARPFLARGCRPGVPITQSVDQILLLYCYKQPFSWASPVHSLGSYVGLPPASNAFLGPVLSVLSDWGGRNTW
jgi:hypothetical protein